MHDSSPLPFPPERPMILFKAHISDDHLLSVSWEQIYKKSCAKPQTVVCQRWQGITGPWGVPSPTNPGKRQSTNPTTPGVFPVSMLQRTCNKTEVIENQNKNRINKIYKRSLKCKMYSKHDVGKHSLSQQVRREGFGSGHKGIMSDGGRQRWHHSALSCSAIGAL